MLVIERFVCECFGTGVPEKIANIIRLVYNAIRIGVPVILVIVGMLDMGKAVTMHDENEIKKAQSLLIRKLIAGGLVFLILSFVSLLLSVVDNDHEDDMGCVRCLLMSPEKRDLKNNTSTVDSTRIGVTSISFNTTQLNIKPGDTKTIHLSINPPNASNKSITFINDVDGVASFNETLESDGFKITIKGEREGIVKYTAISNSNNGIQASIVVKVSNSNQNLELDKSKIYLGKNQNTTLKVSMNDVTWTSSNPDVAIVNNGKVIALKEGTSTITARHDNQVSTIILHVLDIDTTNTIKKLQVGSNATLLANVLPNSDGVELKWSLISGNENLSLTGNTMKGLKAGNAKVRADIYTGDGSTGIYKDIDVVVEKAASSKVAIISSSVIQKGNAAVLTIKNVENAASCQVTLESGTNSDKNVRIIPSSKNYYNSNKKECTFLVEGLSTVKNKNVSLYLGTNKEITARIDKPITIVPDFLGKTRVNNDKLLTITNLYTHLTIGDRRKIDCEGCKITYIDSKNLKIKVDNTFDFNVKLTGTSAIFIPNSKNIEIEGISIGRGNINIVSMDSTFDYNSVIYYEVYGKNQNEGSLVCYDETNGKTNNDLIPLKFNEVLITDSNRKTLTFLFWGNETNRINFSIEQSAITRLNKSYSSVKCSDFVADLQVQAEINGMTDSIKVPGLYRMKLQGDNINNCYAEFTRGLDGACDHAKLYGETIRVYYAK